MKYGVCHKANDSRLIDELRSRGKGFLRGGSHRCMFLPRGGGGGQLGTVHMVL